MTKLTKAQADKRMLDGFKVRLNEKGYTPRPVNIPHPIGVQVGYDGLTIPTLSADCPFYLLGRALNIA